MHILEAGFEEPARHCVVLLHGFPELAYTFRNQLLPLSRCGLHVIAPDLRGHGRTAPRPVGFNDDLLPYVLLNRVSDVIGLIRALGFWPAPDTNRNSTAFRGAQSMYRLATSPVPVSGASINRQVHSRRCREAHARDCLVFTWSMAPAIRLRRNSRMR